MGLPGNDDKERNRIAGYVRSGWFPAYEKILEDALWLGTVTAPKGRLGLEDQVARLRDICLTAELYDYCGKYDEARRAISEPARFALAELREESRKGIAGAHRARELRQNAWTVVHYGISLYRRGRTEEALKTFNECERILDAILPTGAVPAHEAAYGLRSRIAYAQGVASIHEGDIRYARRCFSRSMDFQYKRYAVKREFAANESERKYEAQCSLYMDAKIHGLGLGWCSIRAGELLRARATLSCARTALDLTNDWMHRAFLDLRYAETLRAQGSGTAEIELNGSQHGDLSEAIALLEPLTLSSGQFRRYPKHRARALYELAAAKLAMDSGDPDVMRIVEEITGLSAGERWGLYARLLESRRARMLGHWAEAIEICGGVLGRLAQKNKPDADTDPGDGSKKSEDKTQLLARAHIEMAQAQIGFGNFAGAKEGLEWAKSNAAGNPLLLGVCHLLLARCHIGSGHRTPARRELDDWRSLQPGIEHGFARTLASEVEQEVTGRPQGFVLEADAPFAAETFGPLQRRLKIWVVQQYLAKYPDQWVPRLKERFGWSRSHCHNLAQAGGLKKTRPPRGASGGPA